jgi:hypothetical protein
MRGPGESYSDVIVPACGDSRCRNLENSCFAAGKRPGSNVIFPTISPRTVRYHCTRPDNWRRKKVLPR